MFCPNCGNNLPDGSTFCSACGTQLAANNQQPTYQQPTYQQPTYQQPTYQQPVYQQPANSIGAQPDMPMGWFKFLINFALFAGAILNFASAIQFLTGSIYGTENEKDLVYYVFPDLETLNMIVGVLLIGLAALQIFTRFRLAGFYKNGPLLLYAVYAGVLVVNLIAIIGTMSIVDSDGSGDAFTSMYTGVAVNIVMLIVNIGYFNKRKHMFTK